MPFIWNDKSFGKRLIGEANALIVVFLPIMVLNFIFYTFLMPSLVKEGLLWTIFISSAWFYTFINMFFQFPNSNIPDSSPKWWQTILYIVHFLIASLAFYLTLKGFTYTSKV